MYKKKSSCFTTTKERFNCLTSLMAWVYQRTQLFNGITFRAAATLSLTMFK